MNLSNPSEKATFPCAFICTILSVLVFAAAAPLGVLIASVLYADPTTLLSAEQLDPYAGCDLLIEYAVRSAQLCIPTLAQFFLCWLAAYVRFDKLLLAGIFAVRGMVFGTALRLCLLTDSSPMLLLCTLVHAAITLIFLATVFHIRTRDGIRPFPDALSALLLGGGICCAAVIPTTFFLR